MIPPGWTIKRADKPPFKLKDASGVKDTNK